MKIIPSLWAALAMYSRLPTPKIDWREENRRYALCFLPVIGVVISGSLLGWQWLCCRLQIGKGLFAAICTAIPIFITGGIHMDGFYDVTDAVSSCQPTQKKLLIMSDPHIGSFAAMKGSLYLLTAFGLWTEVEGTCEMRVISLGFLLSRALSGYAAVTFRTAKKEGSLQDFARPAEQNITKSVLRAVIGITAVWLLMVDLWGGITMLTTAMLTFIGYRQFAYRHFNGLTGDLAGWFVQRCELYLLAAVVIIFKIKEAAAGCIW